MRVFYLQAPCGYGDREIPLVNLSFFPLPPSPLSVAILRPIFTDLFVQFASQFFLSRLLRSHVLTYILGWYDVEVSPQYILWI